MSKLILDNWLGLVGFEANPFATREAESEGPALGEFFVEYPYFDEVRGSGRHPETTFLFADRGCGKSANRCMIEEACRDQEIEGQVLAIPHTDFRSILRQVEGDVSRVTLDMHLHEILRQGVVALLGYLQHFPDAMERLCRDEQPRWVALTPSTYLTSSFINRLLRRAGGIGLGLTAERLREAFHDGDYRQLILEADRQTRLTVYLLAVLLHANVAEATSASPSPVAQLEEFVDLLRCLGFDAAYVLVDRVDELPDTAQSARAGVALLSSLLKDLSLLELPRVAFKFFLPTEMQPGVQALVRTDRVLLRHVTWAENDLRRLLQARLEAFSANQAISSLSQISEPEVQDIDQRLVHQAVGSPRNLIRLGGLLFSEHCRLPVKERLHIDAQDWTRAIRRYWSELGLQMDHVSGRVTVAGRELPPDALSPREYDVLEFLYQHAGELCSRDDIAYNIYGTESGAGVSDSAIDQAVSRLRKKIEPGDDPLFIVTVLGKGYRLDHARRSTLTSNQQSRR